MDRGKMDYLVYSLDFDLRILFILEDDSQEKVSGKHFFGIKPYLFTRFTSISHCPPS